MRDLVEALERLAPYQCPVLILGEAGSGKKAVAEALHIIGPRRDAPLIKFNCAGLADTTAPMQLFGSAQHGFGGASATDPGCFQFADGGSLLLDAVDQLPLGLQGKLLRAVENLEVQPVGSVTTVHLDVRLFATTNRDLAAMVKAGHFRPDLYYRLLGASLRIPPLRDRTDDLEPLIADLVAAYNRSLGKDVSAISADALTLMRAHRWPGNLREMISVIERAMLFCDGDRISVGDLPIAIAEEVASATPWEFPSGAIPASAGSAADQDQASDPSTNTGLLDDALKDAVERSLAAAHGDCIRAAEMLGVSRAALYYKMVRFGLTSPASTTTTTNGLGLRRQDLRLPPESDSHPDPPPPPQLHWQR
jgi:DNA-binding NtrC family response regulator